MTEEEIIKKIAKRKEKLASGVGTPFWDELSSIIKKEADPEKFLAVKTEMGIKGYWYMRGYIQAMRTVLTIVETSAKNKEVR